MLNHNKLYVDNNNRINNNPKFRVAKTYHNTQPTKTITYFARKYVLKKHKWKMDPIFFFFIITKLCVVVKIRCSSIPLLWTLTKEVFLRVITIIKCYISIFYKRFCFKINRTTRAWTSKLFSPTMLTRERSVLCRCDETKKKERTDGSLRFNQ